MIIGEVPTSTQVIRFMKRKGWEFSPFGHADYKGSSMSTAKMSNLGMIYALSDAHGEPAEYIVQQSLLERNEA